MLFHAKANAVLIFNNINYVDAISVKDGQAAHFDGVVLIIHAKGNGSGVLMRFPKPFEHLNGRVILTSAHNIHHKINAVYLRGLAPTDSSEDSPKDPLNIVQAVAHPNFVYDPNNAEATREHDYGLLILDTPLNLSLLSLSKESIDKEVAVTIVGYGSKIELVESEQQPEDMSFRKRAFESSVASSGNKGILHTDLTPNANYVFASPGDSGGPVLIKGRSNEFIAIVAGYDTKADQVKYVRPTSESILALVPDKFKKATAAQSGAVDKPETAAAGSGMAVTTAVKPGIAAAAGGGGAAVNVGMDDGKSKAANLSAPKTATGGAAAAGGGVTPPPVTAKPAQPVVDDATPAAGK